jgi:spore maturation protein B
MQFILYLSQYMIPLVVLYIVGYGFLARVPVYDRLVAGARDGMKTVIEIVPTLIGLMTATGVLRASGFLDFMSRIFMHVAGESGSLFPAEVVPLVVLRLFSSSAATGLLLDLYKEFGTDSRIGLTASLLMCCTETVFYTMSVYYAKAGVKKTRYTLAGALLATGAGIAASVWLAGMM